MQFNAIGIISRNIPESIRFYTLLGLRFDDCENTAQHVEAKLPNGMRLMLDAEELMKSLKPHWTKPSNASMSLAFECKSSAEVDEAFKKLKDAGFKSEKEPWDAFWGQRYAVVLDPDNNPVDLYAAL